MKPRSSLLRFLIVAFLLAATAAVLQARQMAELVPRSDLLSSFPIQVSSWTGQDMPIEPDVLTVLGPGDFLSRIYTQSDQPYIDFFLAYFPSQQSGDTVHSPKNCLPGSGWTPLESSRIRIATADGASIPANRYIISKGLNRQLVIYWYQAHGRALASEYWAKFYLVVDAIRNNRTDGSLVRIVTPIEEDQGAESAQQRAASFAQQIVPMLDKYVPR